MPCVVSEVAQGEGRGGRQVKWYFQSQSHPWTPDPSLMQNQNIGLYKRPGQAGSPALASGHLGAPAELTRSWDIGSVAQRSSRSGSCHANLQLQIPIFFSVLKMSFLIESQKRQKYSRQKCHPCASTQRGPLWAEQEFLHSLRQLRSISETFQPWMLKDGHFCLWV